MNSMPAAIAIDVPNISLPLMRGKLISAEYTPTGETHKPIIIPMEKNHLHFFNKGVRTYERSAMNRFSLLILIIWLEV